MGWSDMVAYDGFQPPQKSDPKTQPTYIVKLDLTSIVLGSLGWVDFQNPTQISYFIDY